MRFQQISTSNLILAAILLLFVAKGLVLSFLIPIFQNPDEQVHYGTVQQWAASEEEKSMQKNLAKQPSIDGNDIRTSNLPEETVQSAYFGKFDEVKFEKQNIQDFSDPRAEDEIIGNDWKRYIDAVPSAVSETKSVYYLVASQIEQIFSDKSIFVRIFSLRMLAVILGGATVLLAYLTARKIGFSDRMSLFITTLVAFQPMFSATAAQVNIDIALIFSSALFFYAGVSFLKSCDSESDSEIPGSRVKPGMTTLKFGLLSVFATVLGIFSKGPGVVLIAGLFTLFVWGVYKRVIPSSLTDVCGLSKDFGILRSAQNDREGGENGEEESMGDKEDVRDNRKRKFFAYLAIATVVMGSFAFLVVPKSYLVGITNFNEYSQFDSTLKSIGKYLNKTMNTGELRDTSLSYWGNFGWLDTPIPGWTLSTINWIEIVGFVAILVYLLAPVILAKAGIQKLLNSWIPDQVRDDKVGWIPERKYLVFFLGMILALQIAIRFYDWRIFDTTGQILIGQPGRYFLPNIVGHLILVSVGLGLAVSWARQFVIPNLLRNLGWTRSLVIRKQERDPSTSLGMTAVSQQSGIPRNDKAYFEMFMKALALGMILLQLHAIVNVIIPRYYL